MQSETADNIVWNNYTTQAPRGGNHSLALSRITFEESASAQPLHRVLELAGLATTRHARPRPLFVVVGRSRRMAVDTHKQELLDLVREQSASISFEATKTFGEVGAAFVAAGANASVIIVQAASTSI
jgi:hypothetical protein